MFATFTNPAKNFFARVKNKLFSEQKKYTATLNKNRQFIH